MKNKPFTIPKDKIEKDATKRCMDICSFSSYPDPEKRKDCMNIYHHISDNIHVNLLLSSYSPNIIVKNTFYIDGLTIPCTLLEQLPISSIQGIYFYLLSMPSIHFKSNDLLEQFYIEAWETAYIDTAHNWLKQMLLQKSYHDFSISSATKLFITNSLGPGFYGISMESLKQYFQLFNAHLIHVTLSEHGIMYPPKSNIGFFLILNQASPLPQKDCASCLSTRKHCEFCKNFAT